MGLRIAQRNFAPAGPSLDAMKSRFPTAARASWRERFLAIARQADPAAVPAMSEPRHPRLRVRPMLSKPHRIGIRSLNPL